MLQRRYQDLSLQEYKPKDSLINGQVELVQIIPYKKINTKAFIALRLLITCQGMRIRKKSHDFINDCDRRIYFQYGNDDLK